MYHILICDDEQDIVNALKNISDESGLQTVRGQHRSAGP